MALDNLFGAMVIYMKGTFMKIKFKDVDKFNIIMEINIKENG